MSQKIKKRFTPSFIDLSLQPKWDANKAWVIDIIVEGYGDGEGNSNFLFQADIQADGTVENKTCDQHNEKSYIVLDNDMYDINSFVADQDYDGKLSFTVNFGANTPRGPSAAKGWMIRFDGLEPIPGTYNFQGKCGHNCDGSGTALKMRNVKLLRYKDLTPEQKRIYPDTRVESSHYWPTNYSNFQVNSNQK